MSTFTDAEVEYLKSQPLGRTATVDSDGRPHVTPVGVFYDPDWQTLAIGSAADMAASKKFRDPRRHRDVAVVVDDLAAIDPRTPRSIEIRGLAETRASGGAEIGTRLDAGFPWVVERIVHANGSTLRRSASFTRRPPSCDRKP